MTKTVRLIESIKNEGYEEGYKEGYKEGSMKIIKNAIKNHSIEEIADFFCISTDEVQKYLEM